MSFQFRVKHLIQLITATAVYAGAMSGAFGEGLQLFTATFTFWLFAVVLLTLCLLVAFVIAITPVLLTCQIAIWLMTERTK